MDRVSIVQAVATEDSKDGRVAVQIMQNPTYVSTYISVKKGDTVSIQTVNFKNAVVVGVVGRGDEIQTQLDTTSEDVDKLDNNIKAEENYCLIASNNEVVKDAGSVKDINNLKSNGGRQILVSDAAVIVTPPRDIYQDEVATLQWVKDYVEKSKK